VEGDRLSIQEQGLVRDNGRLVFQPGGTISANGTVTHRPGACWLSSEKP